MSKLKLPVKKNEEVTVLFEDLTHQGNGVCKINGYPVFVPGGLPNEKAVIKVVKTNKRFGFGILVKLLTKSEERVVPPCKVYDQCGGCQIQHMSQNLQSNMKKTQIEHLLQKTAQLPDVAVNPVIVMKEPWHYRNKIQMPVGEKNGEIITGFYKPRSHDIIDDMDTCLIQHDIGNDILAEIRILANELGISAYNEREHKGTLRHIIIRTGYETDEVMVTFVTNTKDLPHSNKIIKRLTEKFPEIVSIVHNVNLEKTNVIIGKKMHLLYGEKYLYDKIDDLTFGISSGSFYQVNPEQAKKLYNIALDYAEIDADDVVVDAYCGIGTISLFLAQQAKQVYGIEIFDEAVQDAKMNAQINKITNAEFFKGAAEELMPKWKANGFNPDVITVDPPRKGCDESLLEAMIEMNPKKIIYVSCNPATLARDLKILAEYYDVKQVQPVDLFPQTYHIETVVQLERK